MALISRKIKKASRKVEGVMYYGKPTTYIVKGRRTKWTDRALLRIKKEYKSQCELQFKMLFENIHSHI